LELQSFCQLGNLTLSNAVTMDWLNDTLCDQQ